MQADLSSSQMHMNTCKCQQLFVLNSHLHAKLAKLRSGTSLMFTFSLLGFGRVSLVYLLGITKDTTYLQKDTFEY